MDHVHRLWYHSTLGLRVIKKKKKKKYASQTMLFNKVSCSRVVLGFLFGVGVQREAHLVKWMSALTRWTTSDVPSAIIGSACFMHTCYEPQVLHTCYEPHVHPLVFPTSPDTLCLAAAQLGPTSLQPVGARPPVQPFGNGGWSRKRISIESTCGCAPTSQ